MDSNALTGAIRPEAELLLSSARTCIDPDAAGRIRTLAGKVTDWDYLLRTGAWHGVLALLHRSLNAVCPEAVPSARMSQLRAHFQANVRRSLFLTAELLRLLELLQNHSISAIPFKGPVLAASAYGSLALREFVDLDILVKREDFAKARGVLISKEYRPWRQLTSAEEASHLRSEHAYALARRDEKFKVDLHWRVAPGHCSFALDPKVLWSRLESISIAGRDVPTLHPEDLVLILCMHGSKHLWERLAWVCDVAELVRRNPGLDWEKIVDRSRQLNMERVVLLGLGLAKDLLGARLPEPVLSKIRSDRRVRPLSARIRARLFADTDQTLRVVERTALYLRMRERLRNKVPYLLYRLRRMVTPNERDFMLLPLPGFLRFLYYPLRLLRLAAAYGSGLMARF